MFRWTLVVVVFFLHCGIGKQAESDGEAEKRSPWAGFQSFQPPPLDPSEPVDYYSWVNETFGAPLRENAFDTYLEAYSELEAFDTDWGDTLTGPWSENRAVSEWLAANREGLRTFRRAASEAECFFELQRPATTGRPRADAILFRLVKPAWRGHIDAGRALIAEGWRAWSDGREEVLRHNAILVIRSGHHLSDDAVFPLARLIGDANLRIAYRALRIALHLSGDPMSLATDVVADLRRADPPLPPFVASCRLLRIELHDLYQRLFVRLDDDGGWKLDPDVAESLELDANDLATIAGMGMEAGLRECDQYYDELEEWLAMPYHLASRAPDPLERLRARSGNPLNGFHGEVNLMVRARVERAMADRRATHLIAEVLSHLGKGGELPENLGELVAGPEAAELLRDPLSGRDFVYERDSRVHRQDFRLHGAAAVGNEGLERQDPEWNDGDIVYWPCREVP